MKVLITGANGQVGHELQAYAKENGINCVSFPRVELDITDLSSVRSRLENSDVDFIINAAAYTAVDAAEENVDDAYSVNRDGVKHLATICAEKDIPLLHISTDFVFDGNKTEPYHESDKTNPLSVYGESKLAGEEVLRETWKKHIILRTAWVYGEHGGNFVKTMLRLMQERDELKVVGDQWGCPTSAASIAKALMQVAAKIYHGKEDFGTYHFSGSGRTNWCDFAREIQRQASEIIPINVSIKPIGSADWVSPATRPLNSVLSCEKIQTNFDIPSEQWQDQLRPVIAALVS